jgi:hypothetical protein
VRSAATRTHTWNNLSLPPRVRARVSQIHAVSSQVMSTFSCTTTPFCTVDTYTVQKAVRVIARSGKTSRKDRQFPYYPYPHPDPRVRVRVRVNLQIRYDIQPTRAWLCRVVGERRSRPPGHRVNGSMGLLLPDAEWSILTGLPHPWVIYHRVWAVGYSNSLCKNTAPCICIRRVQISDDFRKRALCEDITMLPNSIKHSW